MSNEIEKVESRLYELGYHIIPTLSEGDFSAEVDSIKKLLDTKGAEIVKEGEPKLIDLKYTMIKHIAGSNKKFGQAYFGWIKFNLTAEGIEELKKDLDLNQNFLRYILIKTVNDDAHSTSKIEMAEGETGIEEVEAEEDLEEETEKVSEESKDTGQEVADASGQPEKVEEPKKELDEVIEELVK